MTNTSPRLPAAPMKDGASPTTQPDTGALQHLGGLSPLFAPTTVADARKLRMGGLSPLFAPATVADAGKLRMGGLSPLFAPTAVADAGKLRMGGLSPLFGRG